jgi:hypothetical protein
VIFSRSDFNINDDLDFGLICLDRDRSLFFFDLTTRNPLMELKDLFNESFG